MPTSSPGSRPTRLAKAGLERTIRPSASSTVLPIGAASNAPLSSASERLSARRPASSSVNTATFERKSSGSNGLST